MKKKKKKKLLKGLTAARTDGVELPLMRKCI